MNKQVEQNRRTYLQRVEFYRGFGYDLEKERDFILDCALPVAGDILEIGTGKGHFALALAKRGFFCVSVDINTQEQRIALLNLSYFGLQDKVSLRTGNAECLDFPDRSFDVIFSVNVFHHLERPQAVLEEIIRLLRPRGKIVLADFTDKGLEMINACHTHEGRTHDHFKHRLDEARDYLAAKGFPVSERHSLAQRVIIA